MQYNPSGISRNKEVDEVEILIPQSEFFRNLVKGMCFRLERCIGEDG